MSERTGRKVINYPLVLLGILAFLTGCASDNYIPVIVGGTTVVQPPPPPDHHQPTPEISTPREWTPPVRLERSWTAIVIHHSGTDSGNAAIFDKWHREGKHWEGVGYDFIIGNGTDSGNGEVEVTFRWTEQKTGAHCKTPDNWANEHAIGICLVGNFDKTKPTGKQMWSLAKLVRSLQARYNIPASRIYGHKDTPGAMTITDCPGRYFSMSTLKHML